MKSLLEPQTVEQFGVLSLPRGAWSDGNGMLLLEIC